MAVKHYVNSLNINDKTNYKVLFFSPGLKELEQVWSTEDAGEKLIKSRDTNREIKVTLAIYGSDQAALRTNIANLNAELVKDSGVYTYNQGGTLSDIYFDVFKTNPIYMPDKLTYIQKRIIVELTLPAKPGGRGDKVTVGSLATPAFSNVEVPNVLSVTGIPGDVNAKARLFVNKLTGTTSAEVLRLGRYTKGSPLSDFIPIYEAETYLGDYGSIQSDSTARGSSCVKYTPAASGVAYNVCRLLSTNLIQNPGFETWTPPASGADFANWTENRPAPNVVEAYTADKYEGTTCLHINKTVAGDDILSDFISVAPSLPYVLTCRRKWGSGYSALASRILVKYYDSGQSYLSQSVVSQPWTSAWDLFQTIIGASTSNELYKFPSNAAYVKVVINDNVGAIDLYFDAFEFRAPAIKISTHRGKYRLLVRPKTADTPANVSYRYKVYCGDRQDWKVKTGAWVALSQTPWKIYDLGYIEIPSNQIPEGVETYQVIEIEMKSATATPLESRLDCIILMPYGDANDENSIRAVPGLFQVNDIAVVSSIDNDFFLSKNQGGTETLEASQLSAIKEGKPFMLAPGTNKIVLADSLDGADSTLHKYNVWYEYIPQYLLVR